MFFGIVKKVVYLTIAIYNKFMLPLNNIALFSPIFVCGILFLIFIFENRKINPPKFNIAFLMLLGLIFTSTIIVNQTGNYLMFAYLAPIYYSSMLCLAPIFYFYIKSLTREMQDFRKNTFHLLPATLYLLVSIMVFMFMDSENKTNYITQMNNGITSFNGNYFLAFAIFVSNKFVFSLQIIFYFFLIRKEIAINKNLINELFSGHSNLRLNWLVIINIVFLVGGVNGLIINFTPTEDVNLDKSYLAVSLLFFSLFFLLLGIIASRQQPVMQIVRIKDAEIKKNEENQNDDKLYAKILEYIVDNKAFANQDLNIWDVASNLNTNRTYISNSINKNSGKNFNCFINTIRINEIIKRIENNSDEIDLKNIAYEYGFNSNSSFYRNFKIHTGKSPKEYIQEIESKKNIPS
jgi:AraC-like DNA-binding protein